MTVIRWVVVTLMAGLLSGCFVSHGNLVTTKNAVYPIASGTRFTVWKLDEHGHRKTETPTRIIVTRNGSNYVYNQKGEKPVTGLLADLGHGNYIVLLHDNDHPGQSLYGALRKSGTNWLSHDIVCSDFAKLAAAHGRTLADFHTSNVGGDCSFADYNDLKSAVIFELRYGKPDTEYVAGK